MCCYIVGMLSKSTVIYFDDYESFTPFLDIEHVEWDGDDFTPHIMLLRTKDFRNDMPMVFSNKTANEISTVDDLLYRICTTTLSSLGFDYKMCSLGVQLEDFLRDLDFYCSVKYLSKYYNKAFSIDYLTRDVPKELYLTYQYSETLEIALILHLYCQSICKRLNKLNRSNYMDALLKVTSGSLLNVISNKDWGIFKECYNVYYRYKDSILSWLSNGCYEYWKLDRMLNEFAVAVLDCHAAMCEPYTIRIEARAAINPLFKDIEKYILLNQMDNLPKFKVMGMTNLGIFLLINGNTFIDASILQFLVYDCFSSSSVKLSTSGDKHLYTIRYKLKRLFLVNSVKKFAIEESSFTDKLIPYIRYAFAQLLLKTFNSEINMVSVDNLDLNDITISFKNWDGEAHVFGRLEYDK